VGADKGHRTTRTAGYALIQRSRKRVEEPFGWKRIGQLRKLRHRGAPLVDCFTFTAATYNVVRLQTLLVTA